MTEHELAAAIVATKSWFAALRREWNQTNSGQECPVPDFDTLTPSEQMRFVRSIHAAIKAADPKNVQRMIIEGKACL